MRDYANTHITTGNPWINWRKEARDSLVQRFVKELDHNTFVLALTAYKLDRVYESDPSERMLTLPSDPSDGDLSAIDGTLAVENTPDLVEWAELLLQGFSGQVAASSPVDDYYEDPVVWVEYLLGELPGRIHIPNLIVLAVTAASEETKLLFPTEVERAGISKVLEQLSQLCDKVDSTNAVQVPMIDLLERLVKRRNSASWQEAEESLLSILGKTYSDLCHEARGYVVASEQIYRNPEFREPGLAVFSLAKAFELETKASFLPSLVAHLKNQGIEDFPAAQDLPAPSTLTGSAGSPVPGEPPRYQLPKLLNKGRENTRFQIGSLSDVLESDACQSDLEEFCLKRGFKLKLLQEVMQDVRKIGNRAKHEPGMARGRVEDIRRRWLGIDKSDGGIFAALHSE